MIRKNINIHEKVCNYITRDISWNAKRPIQVIPRYILMKVRNIPLPCQDIKDKMTSKFTQDGQFFMKMATCANNDNIRHRPKAKFLSGWKLDFLSRMKIFAWRLIRGKITTRGAIKEHNANMRNHVHYVNGNEDINHLSKHCIFVETSWKEQRPTVQCRFIPMWNLLSD